MIVVLNVWSPYRKGIFSRSEEFCLRKTVQRGIGICNKYCCSLETSEDLSGELCGAELFLTS